ncbi:MAG: malate synthase A [Acidimicrobiia bacterium]|nr:malate synthase A [Acidimicrobiia bacterium]
MSNEFQWLRPIEGRHGEILTTEALQFVADLEEKFGKRRLSLIRDRVARQEEIDGGAELDFLTATEDLRAGGWKIAPIPADLENRRVEITGPVDRKMMINALNSGADTFMADFEDATSPIWSNLIDGHVNLVDAYRRDLSLDTGEKQYTLDEEIATLIVRPRGWHLPEANLLVDGELVSASLFDFGLYMFHGARAAIEAGTGPYFYLPKLQSHLEARLWNDVFTHAQDRLGIPHGTIKATVLIEHILAVYEMDEILYELREHSSGLNAGRWDYIFSVIKTFRNHADHVLPDRAQVTMTVPFMKAYTELQVATCHRRGAHAMGGMAAFIPNRRMPEVTEEALEKVAADKRREAEMGYDGTWVAHPGLVEVARAEFDRVLDGSPNQVERLRDDVSVGARDLVDTTIENGSITDAGIRTNVSVGIRYLASWLSGVGAAAIDNLMEDAATAEISRSQIWQWVHHAASTDDGVPITAERVRAITDEEMALIENTVGEEDFAAGRFDEARTVFERVALDPDYIDFLTLPAYELL